MLFIGVALIVAAGLALVVVSDVGSLVGLTQLQTQQMIAIVGFLILIAGGAFGRRIRLGEMLTNLVLWVGIFAIVIVGYTYRTPLLRMGERVLAEVQPGAAVVDPAAGTASFQRGLGGSFRVNATVNGAKVHLIFDTGASAVVLTHKDAVAAGVPVDRLTYSIPVKTANGTGEAALVTLHTIDVGGIVRHNVRAYVVGHGALDTSLLGMTFLETLRGYAVNQDTLVLHN